MYIIHAARMEQTCRHHAVIAMFWGNTATLFGARWHLCINGGSTPIMTISDVSLSLFPEPKRF